jgi:hypothetical protein
MSATISTRKLKLLERFSAVDLVTMAVFAALHRALWYVWHALGMFFPYSQVINTFFLCLVVIAAVIIVRKPWTMTLTIIANQLINLFLQGEPLISSLIIMAYGILADLYLIFRMRQNHDPYKSTGDLMIAGTMLVVVFYFVTYTILMKYIYLTPIPTGVFWSAAVVLIAGGIAGSWVGIQLGRRLSGLIG